MKKFLPVSLLFTICYLFTLEVLFASPANAVCPVCTVAIGGGVVLSHYLGVDDLIIGVWIGGLVLSLGLWSASSLKKIYLKGQNWFWTAFLWLTTVLGLKQAGLIGQPTCKIHGHDKLLSGIVFGTIAFLAGYGLDRGLRKLNKKNPGKGLFAYQKVILPVAWLVLTTIFAWQLCRFGI